MYNLNAFKDTDYGELLKLEQKQLDDYFEIKNMIDEKLKKSPKESAIGDEINLPKFISNFEFLNNGETKYHNLVIDLSDTEGLKNELEDLLNNPEMFNLEQSTTYKNRQQLGSFFFSKVLSKDLNFDDDLLTNLISSIPLEKSILLDILVISWISNSYSNIKCLYKLILLLIGIENTIENPDEATDTDENLYTTQIDIDAFLKNFQKLCETTSLSNMNSTIIIVWILRSVLIEVC